MADANGRPYRHVHVHRPWAWSWWPNHGPDQTGPRRHRRPRSPVHQHTGGRTAVVAEHRQRTASRQPRPPPPARPRQRRTHRPRTDSGPLVRPPPRLGCRRWGRTLWLAGRGEVSEVMVVAPTTATPTSTVAAAHRAMLRMRSRHLGRPPAARLGGRSASAVARPAPRCPFAHRPGERRPF